MLSAKTDSRLQSKEYRLPQYHRLGSFIDKQPDYLVIEYQSGGKEKMPQPKAVFNANRMVRATRPGFCCPKL